MHTNSIKAFVTAVEGCLTNGEVFIGSDASSTHKFSEYDNSAFEVLNGMGIPYFAITKYNNHGIENRLKHLKFTGYVLGSTNKLNDIKRLLDKHQLQLSEIAYLGDDIADYESMMMAGESYAPSNAVKEIRNLTSNSLSQCGGAGAAREAIESYLNKHHDTCLLNEYLKHANSHSCSIRD